MILLIDDIRDINADIIARNFAAAVIILKSIPIDHIRIDHDLGSVGITEVDGKRYQETGSGILRWMIDANVRPGLIEIVSNNPVGIKNMQAELVALGYKNVATYMYEPE